MVQNLVAHLLRRLRAHRDNAVQQDPALSALQPRTAPGNTERKLLLLHQLLASAKREGGLAHSSAPAHYRSALGDPSFVAAAATTVSRLNTYTYMKSKTKWWRRPRFSNDPTLTNVHGVQAPLALRGQLEALRGQLRELTKLQQRLYYTDLTRPQYLGPSKDMQLLRLPGDLQTLDDIQCDLQYIQKQLRLKAEPQSQPDVGSAPPAAEPAAAAPAAAGQQLHSLLPPVEDQLQGPICTKEIDDIMALPKNELKAVGKRVDRPLVQLKDNTLKWPSRLQRAQPFKDVPLYS